MRHIHWFDEDDHTSPFPPLECALEEPNGLLAAGGPLSVQRLMSAYRVGVFPWFSEGQPVLWWSPDPRAILRPDRIRVSRSLRKRINHGGFEVTLDRAFEQVVRACAAPRAGQPGTWITLGLLRAYTELYERGVAHSVETWLDGRLVGGLYGVAIGRAFFGESMFTRERDASKVALTWLSRQLQHWGFPFIDCQVPSGHLARMGADLIPRAEFETLLDQARALPGPASPWRLDEGFHPLAAPQGASI